MDLETDSLAGRTASALTENLGIQSHALSILGDAEDAERR
jgi:hypothetical protein